MSNSQSTILSSGQQTPKQLPRSRRLGFALLAVLLYLALVDAAVETLIAGSPLRWIISAAVIAYLAINVLLWRKLGWEPKASISFIFVLGLLVFATWRAEGSDSPITMLRQPTSTPMLSAVTILGILAAGWVADHSADDETVTRVMTPECKFCRKLPRRICADRRGNHQA